MMDGDRGASPPFGRMIVHVADHFSVPSNRPDRLGLTDGERGARWVAIRERAADRTDSRVAVVGEVPGHPVRGRNRVVVDEQNYLSTGRIKSRVFGRHDSDGRAVNSSNR
jgi:hypothetical protein